MLSRRIFVTTALGAGAVLATQDHKAAAQVDRRMIGNELPKRCNVFPANIRVSPDRGTIGALGLMTFTGGVRGMCSSLAPQILL